MKSLLILSGLVLTVWAQTDIFGWIQGYNLLPGDCRLPMRPGYSKLKFQQGETKWFFNMTSKQCEPFEYFGRGGNGNRFRTPIHCLRRCGCKVQQDPGHCTNFTFPVIRYAYNSMWRFCSEFEYYGCGGNMNNFATFFECQLGCGGGFEF
uniref:BPTI/Kunitz inhibitor domain-containing protein n=1 Tax=Magallana gigas TaxID=29159 RepID=A0A8W8I308_MAGGI